MTKKFTETQPKDGDKMLHCGHLDNTPRHHFFKLPQGVLQFRRPDGTMGEASWIICCDVCFQKTGGDPHKLDIRGDGTWKGDDPAVFRNEV